jgi:ABC-2 type transport system ATP-binding protein
MSAISIENISYSYGTFEALKAISLEINAKELFALVGPNGGGKSTLFRILCTLQRPKAGKVKIFGIDASKSPNEVRQNMGVVFQTASVDKRLTVWENMKLQGILYGLRGKELDLRLQEALALLGLVDKQGVLCGELSGGMRRRVEIAKSILQKPKLLLMDEPTVGLDPLVRAELWSHLRTLRSEMGMTLFFTTHLSEEVDSCDRIGLLDRGRLVSVGAPEVLIQEVGNTVVKIQTRSPEVLKEKIKTKLGWDFSLFAGELRLETKESSSRVISELLHHFSEQLEGVNFSKPSLQDLFVRKTGNLWQ